ncbi:chitinase [Silvimonas soli]|uniref:chitinase n=1 Tax=Silvimonas soli TaxID=2980100 RepID=UPI0024B38456|nr:glycosyl hydrolase family 18 protein [Silvimonas soli]
MLHIKRMAFAVLPALFVSSFAFSAACSPAWNAATAYVGGNTASFNGVNYTANWWTQNQEPDTNNGVTGTGQPWTSNGACTGGTPTPTPTPTPAPTPTPTPAPTPTPTPAPTPTPTPAPTPTPTPTPAPTPTPTPAPTPSGSLPKHVLVGYWQNFDNGAAVQTLAQVPTAYNVIEVAFANADTANDGGISFDIDPGLAKAVTGGYTNAQFAADIQTLHSQGRFVVLSIGGQNGSITLGNTTAVTNFVNTAYSLIQQYGFDGIDIDLENGINVANLESALTQLHNKVGSNLIITMAPQTIDMLAGIPGAGLYLQVARDLGSIITMVNTQYYNSGSMPGRDGKNYNQGTVDFITAQADTVLQYLQPGQVGLGLPASASGASSGYVDPSIVNNAVDCLTQGTHCGTYIPVAKYPGLRAVMDWSTNWDASNNNNFANTVAPHLKALP